MIDEGILTIYSLENIAAPGCMPTEKLVEVEKDYYAKVTYGITRIYAALGANHRFDTVVRVFCPNKVEQGMYVVLEDGRQYQIDICQEVVGKDAYDLTLVRLEDYYDVAESEATTDILST